MQFKAPRGTTDILPEERPYWRLLESTAERIAENFGYLRIDTPIFEDTGLFVKPRPRVTCHTDVRGLCR